MFTTMQQMHTMLRLLIIIFFHPLCYLQRILCFEQKCVPAVFYLLVFQQAVKGYSSDFKIKVVS